MISHDSEPSTSAPGTQSDRQYLTFTLAGHEWAVPILRVREIVAHDALTKVPTAPPFIRGVMNLRGSVLPVVDLALKLGLTETVVTKRTCVLVLEASPLDDVRRDDKLVIGIMADTVDLVLELGQEDIEPAPEFGIPVRTDFLHGLGKLGKSFVLILDIDHVMTQDEAAAVSEMGGADEHAGAAAHEMEQGA